MSRKAPTPPPPEGIVKPKPPPGPPGPRWFQRADRGWHKSDSNPLIVTTMVYLQFGKQGIRDMIQAVHEYEDLWLKPLMEEKAPPAEREMAERLGITVEEFRKRKRDALKQSGGK